MCQLVLHSLFGLILVPFSYALNVSLIRPEIDEANVKVISVLFVSVFNFSLVLSLLLACRLVLIDSCLGRCLFVAHFSS